MSYMSGLARRSLITVVAAGALVAGTAGPTSTSAGTATATFGKPVQVSANDNQTAAEPSIRAGRDGTLYIVAPTGLGGARTQEQGSGGDLIWRSDDGGKTWAYLGSYDQAAGGGDADIAVDTAGRLWGSGLTLANTTATFSADQGENWCVNPVGSLDTVVDRQWIETYKDELFAFMTTGQITDRRIILSRLELVPPAEDPSAGCPVVSKTISVSEDDSYQWPGEVAVDEKNDYVYVTYNTDDESTVHDQIVVARSDLELNESERFVVTTTKGDSFDSFTVVDVDQAGNVYVIWNERRPAGEKGKFGVTPSFVSVSKDHGKTWSKPLQVNNGRARTTVFPWLVAGSKGRVAITYYGIRHRGPSPEAVVIPPRRIPKWKVFVAYSMNADAANPSYTNVKAVGPYIHAGNVCTSGTGCASGTRDLLDFFQIDLDACGRMVITYTDNSRDTVDKTGNRTDNKVEYIYFVRQDGGPLFYKTPLNRDVC